MGDNSHIEWTDASWNPVLGCSKVSAGCANCYAVNSVHRMAHNPNAKIHAANAGLVMVHGNGKRDWTGAVNCLEDRLLIPVKWTKPRRIFVNSQSDLFHENVPAEFIDKVFAVMAACPQHTFQLLTKRPERMLQYFQWETPSIVRQGAVQNQCDFRTAREKTDRIVIQQWPLPNVWIGVSAEDQKTASQRIPLLLQTPAAVRWLSCEPLLGAVDLTNLQSQGFFMDCLTGWYGEGSRRSEPAASKIDWVICGGESGPGARPMHPEWARGLRDQCTPAHVAYFFKQWGSWAPGISSNEKHLHGAFDRRGKFDELSYQNACFSDNCCEGDQVMHCIPKKAAGRMLDCRTWDEYPEVAAR